MDDDVRYVTPEAIARGVVLPPGEYRMTGDAGMRVPIVAAPNLAEFLLARIAEDEVELHRLDGEVVLGIDEQVGDWAFVSGYVAAVDRQSPERLGLVMGRERLRAECDAKRRIVKLHGRNHECPAAIGIWDARDIDPCPTLLVLAQPHADHPDFRDEWRLPDTPG